MMKKLLLVAAVLACAACGKKDDYARLLPADAAMVMSVSPAQLAEKAEVGDFSKSIFYQYAEKQLGENNDLTDEQRAYMLTVLKNPSELGLDADKPIYLFGKMHDRNAMRGGVLAAVADRNLLDKAFKAFPEAETEQIEGITVCRDDRWTLAYNGSALLFYVSSDEETAKDEALALFTQKPEQSLTSDKEMFAALTDGKHDMRFVCNYGPLMEMAQKNSQMQLPGFEFLGQAVLGCTLDFEPGRVVLKSTAAFRTPEAKKQAEELTAFLTGTPSGELLKLVPEKNLGLAGFNLKGANLYTTFEKIPVYAMLLGMAPQAKPIISALEGDVLFSMQGVANGMPEFTLLAQVNDVKVLDQIRALLPALKAEEAGYAMPLNGLKLHVGLKEQVLYLTTSTAGYEAVQAAGSAFAATPTADLFRHAGGTMFLDVVAVRELVQRLAAEGKITTQGAAVVLPILGLFENVQLVSESDRQEMVVNMTDKEKNAAATLYKAIEGFAQLGLMR